MNPKNFSNKYKLLLKRLALQLLGNTGAAYWRQDHRRSFVM